MYLKMKLRLLLGNNIKLRYRQNWHRRFILPALILCILHSSLQAQLKIEVTEGVEDGVPISILPFQVDTQITDGRREFNQIIAADLAYSGLFSVIPDNSQMLSIGQIPDYSQWLNRGVEKIVFGAIARRKGLLEVRFELHDTVQRRRLLGQVINTAAYDKSAHYISDEIYRELTGAPSIFQTRIAFVTAQRFGWRRHRFILYVSDADGYNATPIFISDAQLMSPAWSPDLKKIAYVSYESGDPEVVIQTLASAARENSAKRIGSAVTPDWSFDGTHLVYVSSAHGDPNIYTVRLSDWLVTRITSHPSIDTEPTWTPEGAIIFTSDRSGQPQLYQVRPGDKTLQRLTYDNHYNSDADVSPDGKSMVFLSRRRGNYVLVIRNLTTGKEVELEESLDIERPRFAANGQLIGYLTADGTLGILTIDGAFGKPIPITVAAQLRGIAWSPLPGAN